MEDVSEFVQDQYNPKQFVMQEQFKFWSDVQCKRCETVQELTARIHQDAPTCDFTSIKNPQDEAMHTRFVYLAGNEAVLKALFKFNDDDLTFCKSVEVALEMDNTAKVAKETVHGSKVVTSTQINKVHQRRHYQCRKELGSLHTHFQGEYAHSVEIQVILQELSVHQ